MTREALRLPGVYLDHKLAERRAGVEEFKTRTTRQVTERVKETSLTVGFTLVRVIAAIATFIIVLVALYRWVDLLQRAIHRARCIGRGDGIIGGCHVYACLLAQKSKARIWSGAATGDGGR
jgi:hypothetical protein